MLVKNTYTKQYYLRLTFYIRDFTNSTPQIRFASSIHKIRDFKYQVSTIMVHHVDLPIGLIYFLHHCNGSRHLIEMILYLIFLQF